MSQATLKAAGWLQRAPLVAVREIEKSEKTRADRTGGGGAFAELGAEGQ